MLTGWLTVMLLERPAVGDWWWGCLHLSYSAAPPLVILSSGLGLHRTSYASSASKQYTSCSTLTKLGGSGWGLIWKGLTWSKLNSVGFLLKVVFVFLLSKTVLSTEQGAGLSSIDMGQFLCGKWMSVSISGSELSNWSITYLLHNVSYIFYLNTITNY